MQRAANTSANSATFGSATAARVLPNFLLGGLQREQEGVVCQLGLDLCGHHKCLRVYSVHI